MSPAPPRLEKITDLQNVEYLFAFVLFQEDCRIQGGLGQETFEEEYISPQDQVSTHITKH